MASGNPVFRLFRFRWGAVDGLRKILHLVLMLMLFSVFVGAMSGSVPNMPSNAALFINTEGYLVEELEGDAISRALDELQGSAIPQTLVRDVVEALERAANDDNVPAVVLNTDGLIGGGLTKLEDIAKAMTTFSSSGKKIYAYGSFFSQEGYYLAAHADEVWLHPTGGIFLTGYGSFTNYFKDALDKLEVNWNVFRVGRYKSYAEPFLRNDMSADSREVATEWLNDLWGGYLAAISTARSIDPDLLVQYSQSLGIEQSQEGNNWADNSLELGLVDTIKSRFEFERELIGLFGSSKDQAGQYNAIGMSAYLNAQRLTNPRSKEGPTIAVVVASGAVVDGEAPPGQIGGDSTARLIRTARLDKDVKALVLRVDSGGGSVFAADVIQDEILAFKASGRPIVASMGSVAASAGYWISAGADKIFASPNTITGSIGVVGMFPTIEKTLGRYGINTDGVGTTPLAGQFRPDRELNESAKLIIQRLVDEDYDRFIGGVAKYRGMEKSAVNDIAQGRVWSGADALNIGLIDEFGDLGDAVSSAAEFANIDAYAVRYMQAEISAFEKLLLDLSETALARGLSKTPRSSGGAARAYSLLESGLNYFGQFNDPMGVYSRCFCVIN